MAKPTPLPGTLTISRLSGGGDTASIRVRIQDASSRVVFVEASLSMVDFAEALLGGGRDTPCAFETHSLHLIGAVAENKEELVPYDCFKYPRDAKAEAKALALSEIEGWVARDGDIHNSHRRQDVKGKPHQLVVFFRHVKDGKPVV